MTDKPRPCREWCKTCRDLAQRNSVVTADVTAPQKAGREEETPSDRLLYFEGRYYVLVC
jgi:hypothetical protein